MIIHNNQVTFILEIKGWFNIRKSINIHSCIRGKKHIIISVDAEKAFD